VEFLQRGTTREDTNRSTKRSLDNQSRCSFAAWTYESGGEIFRNAISERKSPKGPGGVLDDHREGGVALRAEGSKQATSVARAGLLTRRESGKKEGTAYRKYAYLAYLPQKGDNTLCLPTSRPARVWWAPQLLFGGSSERNVVALLSCLLTKLLFETRRTRGKSVSLKNLAKCNQTRRGIKRDWDSRGAAVLTSRHLAGADCLFKIKERDRGERGCLLGLIAFF